MIISKGRSEIKVYWGYSITSCVEFGDLYEVKGYEDQLISLYRESFNLLSANYQAGDATSYIGLYQLSSYYAQHERYEEAISIVCDRVIEKMDVFSAQEKEVVFSKKAFLCFCLDKVDDAIQWKEQAIKYTDKSDKDTYLQNLFNLAFLYGKSGDFAQSLDLYIRLKELLEQENMEMQNLYISTDNEIYGLYEDNLTEAEKFWRACTVHIAAKYNRQNATYAHSINGLGCVMLKADRPNDALSCFRKGQKVLEQLDMENSDAYATALHNVGRAYIPRKRYKQAKNCLEQAKALQIQLSGNVFERTEQYLSELESLMNK